MGGIPRRSTGKNCTYIIGAHGRTLSAIKGAQIRYAVCWVRRMCEAHGSSVGRGEQIQYNVFWGKVIWFLPQILSRRFTRLLTADVVWLDPALTTDVRLCQTNRLYRPSMRRWRPSNSRAQKKSKRNQSRRKTFGELSNRCSSTQPGSWPNPEKVVPQTERLYGTWNVGSLSDLQSTGQRWARAKTHWGMSNFRRGKRKRDGPMPKPLG